MEVTRLSGEPGGTFNTIFNIQPLLTFIPVDFFNPNPPVQLPIDVQFAGQGAWSPNPPPIPLALPPTQSGGFFPGPLTLQGVILDPTNPGGTGGYSTQQASGASTPGTVLHWTPAVVPTPAALPAAVLGFILLSARRPARRRQSAK